MMNWTKLSEKKPTKDGWYLTVIKIYDIYYYEVHKWANNLRNAYSLDFDTEEYEHDGFWDSDCEMGAYEVSNVEAWMEIEEYEE